LNRFKYTFYAIALAIVFFTCSLAVQADSKSVRVTPAAKADSKSTSKSDNSSTDTGSRDRRTDSTGLHKASVGVATLGIYNKVDQLRMDPFTAALINKSAVGADSPFGTQDFASERAGLANIDIAENFAASLIRADRFNLEQLSGIDQDGIVIGSNCHDNVIDLSKGNAIFAPHKDILVLTDLAEISIKAGSLVCVFKPEPGVVAVYDLHDSGSKKITIKTKDEILSLLPGKEIILSNRSKAEAEFEKINPAHKIAYRKLEQRDLPSGTKVYSTEFSIPSAFLYVKPLREILLSDNKEDRKIADHLLKNFVILEDVFGNEAEPYKMPRPLEMNRISSNVQ
jgi:hypothetical protein